MKVHFRESFTIEALAQQSHMSVSSFHQMFKNAVGRGPVQCQKRLRLTEA
ncbi:MAG TPA: helix-turn-helix transcriptional regulator [Candidatus Fimiplasma intestinipullorum]|uniref:Helix-turn-helix transcriptional regulator n=1 Tax=Candidatus Fimiplasma intestinipullorum TaxID=2840825 RepID=A0A9D1HRP4_9FIRM|nr:helix-turn-helix transcriptional regulator [Candidatus Fimiplasma intestinipullorum]